MSKKICSIPMCLIDQEMISPLSPQIHVKAKSGKEKANTIIAGTSGATQKVWHEKPISNAHGIIDTDLARDNLENDLPFADLQDL